MKNTNGLVDRVNALLDDNRRQIGELIGQSAALARETHGLLADNREQLHGTIVNLREFSATLNRRADEMSKEITSTAEELRTQIARTGDEARGTLKGGRDDLQGLLASLRATSAKAEQAADALTSVLRKVDGGTGTLGRLVNDSATVDKVDNAVDQIGGIAGKINAGQGSLGRLVTDDKLIVKLESAADSANRMLGEADRIHLFLGYRGEYLPDANGLKSYVTVKFQPRADKYYLLELVDDPAGKRTITNTTTTIDRPEGSYTLNENTVVDDKSELKVSALFAKEFGALTLRGGMIESQGGAGVDYRLFKDRASVSLDAFDFGREEGAHYKFTGKLRVYKDFFINAGVDDFGEDDRRSAFLGAGILFSDEDLKYVLSLGKYVQ
jgi:phospholipid/cholesterol/gamma-HCH transport system substrate-binding protein